MLSPKTNWLLAMDVDGTILTDDYVVLPEVREAIQSARRKGVIAILATARAKEAVFHIVDDLGGVDAAICLGGSVIIQRDGETWTTLAHGPGAAIAPTLVHEIVKASRQGRISLSIYTEDRVYVDHIDEIQAHQARKTGLQFIETDLLTLDQPVLKILAIGDKETMPAVERIHQDFSSSLSCLYSHWNFLEISNHSVSKGAALEQYRQRCGIDRKNVIAIGDSQNDVAMFAMASISIAMGNATDAVKKTAMWTTDTNQNAGLAQALQRCASTLW
jgi:Cof subfamily protein (haloacid dehalogenase superfamily)